MSISFQCKSCGKKLKAPESAAGKKSTCPGCGAIVRCPESGHDDVIEMGPLPDKAPGFNPFADLDDDTPYAMHPSSATEESSAEGRRPCPMCGESIMTTAAKCRFCGEVFDQALQKAKGKKKAKKRVDPEAAELSAGDIVVALLCSGLGCIAGIVWMIQGKPKGLKMVGISIAADIVKVILRFVYVATRQGGP